MTKEDIQVFCGACDGRGFSDVTDEETEEVSQADCRKCSGDGYTLMAKISSDLVDDIEDIKNKVNDIKEKIDEL